MKRFSYDEAYRCVACGYYNANSGGCKRNSLERELGHKSERLCVQRVEVEGKTYYDHLYWSTFEEVKMEEEGIRITQKGW